VWCGHESGFGIQRQLGATPQPEEGERYVAFPKRDYHPCQDLVIARNNMLGLILGQSLLTDIQLTIYLDQGVLTFCGL
jgi:hypothetical protein